MKRQPKLVKEPKERETKVEVWLGGEGSVPPKPLVYYSLVPCFLCHPRKDEGDYSRCLVCDGRRYVRVDPDQFYVYEPKPQPKVTT